MSRQVIVAAAIVDGDPPRVLAAQRAYPADLAGYWELPGGKVHPGEDEAAALVRECQEELGVDVAVGERVGDDIAMLNGAAILRVYTATLLGGARPVALEHSDLRWLGAAELHSVPWLPADAPIVHALEPLLPS